MAYRSRYSGSYGRRRSRRGFLGWLAALLAVVVGTVGAWWAGWLGPWLGRMPLVGSGAVGTPGPAPRSTVVPGSGVTAGTPPVTPPAVAVEPGVTATTAPTPVPPAEPPGTIGRRYLTAWAGGDFAAMYATLTPAAQARISRDNFINRYLAIKDEAGIVKVTPTPAAGVPETATSLPYTVQIETRVGTVTEQQALSLVQADGRWGIDWTPTLIFKELKGDRLVRFFADNPIRGRILDRHGTVLAETSEAPVIGVIRAEIKNEAALLAGLSQKLGLEPETIKERYSGGQADWWMPIKRLSWRTEEPELVEIQRIDQGIQVRMRPERAYPENMLAAHVVGYVTEVQAEDLAKGGQPGDRIGRAGVEAGVEKELIGERGGRLMIVEKDGSPALTLAQRKAKPGADITLTLDLNIQRLAEAALGDRRGAVVVLEPGSSAILAMASLPAFDPNQFILGLSDETWATLNDPTQRPLMNRTIDGIYPPGSIFKVVTMAAAMEKLGMPRGEQFTCNGSFKLPKAPQVWADWKPGGHGKVNLVQGLTTSCDIVFYTIGQRLDTIEDDGSPLAQVARSFGLGEPTGLAELVEVAGNVPDENWKMKTFQDVWATGDTINFSIGQGFLLVTPLQMANIYAAIANGGTLHVPHLVQRITLPGGPDVRVAEPKERGRLPVQPATLAAIKEGLNGVPTALGGTGYTAFKDYTGPPAAGKTGTAETGTKGVTHAWFASYAPQVDPKLVVIALVEEGKDAEGEGSRVAAPIARMIFEKILPGGPPQPPPAPKPAAKPNPTPATAPKPAPTPARKP